MFNFKEVIFIGLLDWIFGRKNMQPTTTTQYKLMTDAGSGFFAWDGTIYKSDIVRACIRPKSRAIGKLMAQHIRDNENGVKTNPNRDIKFLLEEPNPLMTGQMLREKMTTQLELNNNAFALIKREDETHEPYEIYPIPATSVDVVEGPLGDMHLRFHFASGERMTAAYADVIHLRQDYNNDNVFGDSPAPALLPLMEVVTTIDQGMKKAIKSSAAIRWIMKFTSVLKQKDVDLAVEEFRDNYLKIENEGGVAPSDPRYELEQVKSENYVPDDKQMSNTIERIYDFFNTNANIVQSKYDENEWTAYYEGVVEPVALQLAGEFTRKIFTRRERGHGNKIVFESINLQYASMRTKLNLVQFVDRAMMTPNEVRRIFNMGPIEDGDKPMRRLDTVPIDEDIVDDSEGGDDDKQDGEERTDNERD